MTGHQQDRRVIITGVDMEFGDLLMLSFKLLMAQIVLGLILAVFAVIVYVVLAAGSN